MNEAGRSKWVYLGPILCAGSVVDPRIILPKEYRNGVRVVKGTPLHLAVPYEGRPVPTITWTKKEPPREGWNFLAPTFNKLGDHVTVNNSAVSSILHIKESTMEDTGEYRIEVVVGEYVAEASVTVCVIDRPSAVRKLKVAEVIGNSVSLTWNEPFDTGACEMLGYKVERRDKRSGPDGEWYVAYERVRQCKAMIYDLVQGNAFQFRVFPKNECGYGESMSTFGYAEIEKESFDPLLRDFEPRDVEEQPSFTSKLNTRGLIAGYGEYNLISIRFSHF